MALYAGYGEGVTLHGADALVVNISLEYDVQGNAVSSGKLYENRFISVVTIEDRKLWVGATSWTRWRRCPHLPSGLTTHAHDWRRRCLDRRCRRRALAALMPEEALHATVDDLALQHLEGGEQVVGPLRL
jgi:hypothetical protein